MNSRLARTWVREIFDLEYKVRQYILVEHNDGSEEFLEVCLMFFVAF